MACNAKLTGMDPGFSWESRASVRAAPKPAIPMCSQTLLATEVGSITPSGIIKGNMKRKYPVG